jgi:hypothetical protein
VSFAFAGSREEGEGGRVGADPFERWVRYNNVRYMFEATLNMAQIVGRIPVIPDSAWARTCAVERCVQGFAELELSEVKADLASR